MNRNSGEGRRCYRCDEVGHIAKDCDSHLKDRFSVKCYSCGERGHIAPYCPKKQNAAASFVGNAPTTLEKGKGVATTSGRVFTLTKKDA